MSDAPTLQGPSCPPASGGRPRQLVALLHGVGADGNDLFGLAPYFARALPDAAFVSPHAPFPFDQAPFGQQWFSLLDRSPTRMMEGARIAAPILDDFLDRQLARHGLTNADLALVGFSQGCMMALQVGLRRSPDCAAILGYSGVLVGAETLGAELRARPPVLLVHGDDDPVVPFHLHGLSAAALEALDVPIEAHVRPGLGHSIDEEGLALGADFLRRAFARA